MVELKRELTRQELLDEVYELRRKVFELQGGILIREYQYVKPGWPIIPNDTTGDYLPDYPLTICQSEF